MMTRFPSRFPRIHLFSAIQFGLGWVAAAFIATSLLGCGGGGSTTPREVIVDGSSTVYPISTAAQESYLKTNPNARILVDLHGTGGGFSRYNQGEVDIVDASRPAKPEEEQAAKEQGYDWTRFLVGHDGITVVVHPDNDWVDSLSVSQLKAIFEPESTIARWNEVDPSWPDRPIKLYTPDNDSGTFDFFTEAIVGEEGKQRKDVQASSDDNTLVTGVSGDSDAIGYFGFAYFTENQDKLKPVPIRDGDEAEPVLPTLESIYAKQYTPLSRPLFIYAKNVALTGRPEVTDFVGFYLENVAELAESAGYVAPTDEERDDNRSALQAVTGSVATQATSE